MRTHGLEPAGGMGAAGAVVRLKRPFARTAEDFLARVREDDSGCWLWTGTRMNSGGRYGTGGYGKFGRRSAHRWAYENWVGPIPSGLQIDHLCRTPSCVNPAHLEPVTARENMRRHYAMVTHCAHGHEFTPENTRMAGRHRRCRACERRRSAEYAARKAAIT